jgi:hypothetical protein
MEILNLPSAPTKDVFTAKTEKGYVGCVRTDFCCFFTLESFSNALQAANAARSLRKQLAAPQASKNSSSSTKSIKAKKSSKKSKKTVTWQNRLYTLAEVETMPLLRFKEVWIILRGDNYVSDCLNHEKKRVVSYTLSKEDAQFFRCHEEAKSTMRTLRGVIGPGFNLMRMFIENKE